MKTKSIIVLFFGITLAIFTMALSYKLKYPFYGNGDKPVVIFSPSSMEKISENKFKVKGVKIEFFDTSAKDLKVKYTIIAEECEFIINKEIKKETPNKKDTSNPDSATAKPE